MVMGKERKLFSGWGYASSLHRSRDQVMGKGHAMMHILVAFHTSFSFHAQQWCWRSACALGSQPNMKPRIASQQFGHSVHILLLPQNGSEALGCPPPASALSWRPALHMQYCSRHPSSMFPCKKQMKGERFGPERVELKASEKLSFLVALRWA